MPFDFLRKVREVWKSLTLRYWLALVLFGLFALGRHFLFVSSLDSELFDSATIDLSSRQRFLCERVVHIGWQYAESKLPESRRVWRESMRVAGEVMEDRYQEIQKRCAQLRESKQAYALQIQDVLFAGPESLDAQMKHFIGYARAMLEAPEGEIVSGNPYLMCLNESLWPLVAKLDRLTAIYERGLSESVAGVQRLSLAMVWATCALILLVGLFLFRPIVRNATNEMILLAESEALIRSIMNSSLDAIVIADDKGIIQEWNPQAEALFGWKREDVLGKSFEATVVPLALREQFRNRTKAFLSCGRAETQDRRLEFAGLRKDGTEIPIELVSVFLSKGGQGAHCLFIRDITAQKRIAEEIERHRKSLERRLYERGKKLEENYVRLKNSERMAAIGEVAAKVAHEIRNPLAAIQGSVRLLIKGLNLNSSQEELRSDLMIEIRRLDETVKDLLDFSRPLTAKNVTSNLSVYLEELADYWRLQPAIAGHAIEIQVDPRLEAKIDLHLMNEVLTNLVLNAAQAMEKPGVIKISAKENQFLTITVADTGHGIPAESLPSIFAPFFTTKRHGTGLGLAIVKKNVEAMGGAIAAQSSPGKGASFVITLPRQDSK